MHAAVWTVAMGLCAVALGQSAQEWAALEKLTSGERIKVVQSNGKTVTAEFRGWSAESLRIGGVQLPRTDIQRVERRRPGAMTRGRKAGVYALVGLGVGMAIGAAIPPGCSTVAAGGQRCNSRSEGVGLLGMLGAAAGAVVGGNLPNHGTETLYLRK